MNILGGKLNIGKTADNLLSKLDDSKLTEQEKSELWKDFYKLSLSENSIRSKSRRHLSYIIVGNVFAIIWVCIVMKLKGMDIGGIMEIVEAFQLGWAFFSVVAFFFGVHLLRNYQKK
jgi:hypothetical protein